MRRELSKTDVERLFVDAIDGALAEPEAKHFEEHLRNDASLNARYVQYQHAVMLMRGQPREKAPEVLASVILRRTRRRRSMSRSLRLHEINFSRLPVEVIIPLLLAAAMALFLMTASV